VSAAVAAAFVPLDHLGIEHPSVPALIEASWRWDANWFLSIIRHGYEWHPQAASNVAFFPLYPMVVRALDALVPGDQALWIGVLVNHLFFFLSLCVIWIYAGRVIGPAGARRAVALVCFFPGSLFFSAAYSEALFLLATAGALTLLQMERPLAGGLAGGLAALTRSTGLLLVIPFGLSANRPTSSGHARRFAAIAPIVLALIAFMGYLAIRFDDPFAFVRAQAHWGREIYAFPVTLARGVRGLSRLRVLSGVDYLMNAVDLAVGIGAIGLCVYWWRKDRPGVAYSSAALLVPLTLPAAGYPMGSMTRFAAVLFPLFVGLAEWARDKRRMTALLLVFTVLFALLVALFTRLYHVV
jgi:hypothetical protein